MNLILLDETFNPVSVIDSYESLIWTDRYKECGDFEIYMPVSTRILSEVKRGYYVINNESEHAMIVEEIKINSDTETGNHITISGRSLESILDRRVIWGSTTLDGDIQSCIFKILEESFTNPSKPERKVNNFVLKYSADKYINETKLSAQYTGDNVYEVIKTVCGEHDIGFKLCFDEAYNLVFELYSGVDRSYDQTKNSYVIFSPSFDNLLNSNYIESDKTYKNVALVGGEGEGTARRYTAVGNASGLSRRELFVDANDISSTKESETSEGTTNPDEEPEKMSTEEYVALLYQRGQERLSECDDVTSFEGECEATVMFTYGKDFFKGDIVQIANEYGHQAKVRVLEVVISDDESGFSIYPTFSIINKEDEAT